MQLLQFGFTEFLYIFIHTKHLCKLQHTFLVNLPSIFPIDRIINKTFVRHCCTLSEHVLHWLCLFGYLLTVVLGFWEPCWELFWSINQCSIWSIRLRSIHLWSIRNEVYIWPNFFSRSRLRSNRSLIFLVKVDQKPFGQSKIRSIRVLQY